MKHIVASLFLISFMVMEMASLHGLFHKDEHATEDCPVCSLIVNQHSSPMLEADGASQVIVDREYHTILFDHYCSRLSEKKAVCSIFNRPPPSDRYSL